jgi:peptidoglycan/LPS O-acetylase OafA/YrhL
MLAHTNPPQKSISAAPSIRRHDLDWLRVLAVLLLVPFHSALIFVMDPDSIMYIKDTVNSEFLDRMAGFIHQFHMPLLFAISGASTYLALGFRGAGQYLRERVSRLLVPALFAMVVLLPPMTYITRLARGEQMAFGQHILGFFRLNPDDLAGYYGTLTPAHTWFIIFLFVFSIIALPLFLLERRERFHRISTKISTFLARPFALFLLVIPLALAASLDILGDKNPVYYFLIFCCGYLLMTSPSYQKAIQQTAWVALLLGMVFEVLRQTWHPNFNEWSLPWIGYGLLVEQSVRWLWVLAILGFGQRYLNNGGRVLRYLSEAAFPFYILHLPINTLVGYFIIQLDIPIAVKYLAIVGTTILITFLIFELVRRVSPLRVLFGMKSQSGAQPTALPPTLKISAQ